jgi:hypothetical protein
MDRRLRMIWAEYDFGRLHDEHGRAADYTPVPGGLDVSLPRQHVVDD